MLTHEQLRAKALGRAEVKSEYENQSKDFALHLPIETPHAAPTNHQLRRAADAVFLELDRREAQN